MSKNLMEGVEFTAEEFPVRAVRRPMTGAELITIAALTVSTVIAATAVSIGIARAQVHDAIAAPETSMAFLMVTGLILVAMASLTALAAKNRSARR